MIEVIAQLRPQWVIAVNDAWFNWRFLLGLLIPPCLFLLTTRLRWGGLVSFPFAAAGFWLFVSMGIYNVSDVMASNAVTDAEIGVACTDTGRVLAPFLTVPPASIVYTLFSLGCVTLGKAIFKRRETPNDVPCPNCGRINAVTTLICPRCMKSTESSMQSTNNNKLEAGNPYQPPYP